MTNDPSVSRTTLLGEQASEWLHFACGIEHRSLVSSLLTQSAHDPNGTARETLEGLLTDNGPRGIAARQAFIDELLAYEGSLAASIQQDKSPRWLFTFCRHVSTFLTPQIAREMSHSEISQIVGVTVDYLTIASDSEQWSPAAIRLIEHGATIIDELFVSSDSSCLSAIHKKFLEASYLNFLRGLDTLFSCDSALTLLPPTLDLMISALERFNISARERVLRNLFECVLDKHREYVNSGHERDLGAEPLSLTFATIVAERIVEEPSVWPSIDGTPLSVEEIAKTSSEPYTDSVYGEDFEFPDDSSLDESTPWQLLSEPQESDQTEERLADMDDREAISVESAILALQARLAPALLNCPSLLRDIDLWKPLALEESLDTPGFPYFIQGYAKTSRYALESLVVTIALNMFDDHEFVVALVALLEIEETLKGLHNVDLSGAYVNGITRLSSDPEFQHLETKHQATLNEFGYGSLAQLIDTTMCELLLSSLNEDWTSLAEKGEFQTNSESLKALLVGFIDRVWPLPSETTES